jgi:N-acetylglucosamine-6-sulfatase
MTRPPLAAAALGLAIVLGLSPMLAEPAEAASRRPDIVVIYVDDVPQAATHLWSDPARTPSLARFVHQGTWLKHATGSTPQCCPGRANTLLGQWGHRSGVTQNDLGPFDPTRTIAVQLQRAGYRTLFGGKFLNRFPHYAYQHGARRYAVGWDQFDVVFTHHGKFYNYPLWTRTGTRRYGQEATDHSTFVVTRRMARHIRRTPRNRPVFAFLSLYDGHAPLQPMARFVDHPACRDVEPWRGPAYDEADVSDKPQYVQAKERRDDDGYPLQRLCQSVMTIDWAVGRIRRTLRRAGRLRNTLLVFTSDNGWVMGDHRLVGKLNPYSTPIPLYMMWPRRWGRAARVIQEPVSNVDLAPTFCAIAGCRMRGANGRSLLALLDGRASQVPRRFIYEEMLHARGLRPAWYGIRTTRRYSRDARWVYTEYGSGEVELYELESDPWQLRNLADDPARAKVRAELRAILHERVIGPHRVTLRSPRRR